jgi:multidrug efflux pump subunit AcrB
MKGIIDFFINRSILVNLLTVMILIAGALALFNLQRETFPDISFDIVTISTPYAGSSTEDVEKLVTISLERVLKGIDGIEELNALSFEGRSVVTIKVDVDSDIDEVVDDVKSATDTVMDLPDDIEGPFINKIGNKTRSAIEVVLVGEDYSRLRQSAKSLRDELEKMGEVSYVSFGGYRRDEIRVEVKLADLNRFELTMSEVAQAIQNRNISLSGGTIEGIGQDIMVRTVAEFESLEDIENVVIRSNFSGQKVRVKDLAVVTRLPVKDGIIHRSNGEQAIYLQVMIKKRADIIRTTQTIKQQVEKYIASADKTSIKLHRYANDLSYYVKRRLDILKNNGVIGMGLVFICLLFFLNLRTAIITSLGAPIAFMCAFMMMDWLGYSINMISMFGLIVVLGMLVDDAIIVAEQFYQKIEQGIPPRVAAKEAAFETIRPVTATILTTMVAFGSLFFMGGIMGKFLWQVPAIVIICLTASLFECFFILPGHLADFGRISKRARGKRWYQPLINHYHRSLRLFLKIPGTTIFVFLILLITSIWVAKGMRFELFPGDDVRIVFINLKGEVGTSLEKTDKLMRGVERVTLETIQKEELDQIKSLVGMQIGRHQRVKTGDHYASMIVYLTPPDERERSTDAILGDLTNRLEPFKRDGVSIAVEKVQGGPPKGKAVEVDLSGNDLKELSMASKMVKDLLDRTHGVQAAEIDFEEGKPQVVVSVKEDEAKRLGLNTRQIALELRRALAGDALTEIRESDEDIDVRILLGKETRSRVDSLAKLYIVNQQGRRIPLSRVITTEVTKGAFVIRRMNQKRVISISASLDKKVTNSMKVASDLIPEIKKMLAPYPDITFEFAGERVDTNKSMRGLLKAGVIALFCIFFILVTMFGSLGQPVVVMMAIPLGLIGVIFTFKILGLALGFMALMGVVALIGVVVNDSIVLVTFINERRKKAGDSADLAETILEASLSRFRPVILTTFTTVAGLMPIAHSTGGDPFLKPMAISFAWGLLFSTAVTLVFIPCNYLIYVRLLTWGKRLLRMGGEDSATGAA